MKDKNENTGQKKNVENKVDTEHAAPDDGSEKDLATTIDQLWDSYKKEVYAAVPAAIAVDAAKAAVKAAVKRIRAPSLPGEEKPPASVPGGEKPPASMPGGPEAALKPPVVEPEIEWRDGYWRPKGGEIWEPGSVYQPSAPPGGAAPATEAMEAARLAPLESAQLRISKLADAARVPAAAPDASFIENIAPQLVEKVGDLAGAAAPSAAAPAETPSWLSRTVDAVESGAGRVPGYFGKAGSIAAKAWAFANEPIPYLTPVMNAVGPVLPWAQLAVTSGRAFSRIHAESAAAEKAFNQRDRINAELTNDNPALRFEDLLKQRAAKEQWSPEKWKVESTRQMRMFSDSTGDTSRIPTGRELGAFNTMAAGLAQDPGTIIGYGIRRGAMAISNIVDHPKPLPPPRKLPVMSAVEGPMGPPLPPPGWARPPREDSYANWNLNVGNAEQLGYPPTASLSRRERYRNVMAEAANEGFSDTAAGPPFIVPPAYPSPSPEQFRAAPAVSAPAAPAASRPSSFVPIGASFAAPSSTDAAIAELRELMRSEFAKLNGTLRIYFNCFPPSSLNTRGNYEMDQRR